jgi:hypothetical protein
MIPSLEIEKASDARLFEMGRQFPHAGASALNKIARSTRTFASSEIRKTYNIKKSDLDPNISVINANYQQALWGGHGLRAILRVVGKPLKLLFFGARQTKTGVAVRVKKGQARKIRHGFIRTMKSGHENVFIRTSKKRLPIRGLYGPRITQLFGSRHMKDKIQSFLSEAYPRILIQELKYHFSKL